MGSSAGLLRLAGPGSWGPEGTKHTPEVPVWLGALEASWGGDWCPPALATPLREVLLMSCLVRLKVDNWWRGHSGGVGEKQDPVPCSEGL